jgi:glycolate oxidase iron-sulfur subunit
MPALSAPTPLTTAGLALLADRCVQCGLCLPHCPTYRLDASEAESPRGRIAYIKQVAEGRLEPSEAGDRHLDHCLGCLRCEAACPADVAYETLLVGARTVQAQRRALPVADRLRLGLLAHPRWLPPLLALQSLLPAGLRPLPRTPPTQVFPVSRGDGPNAAIFIGCVASAYESGTRAALARLLAAAGVRALLPSGQTCCGTAAAHAGQAMQVEAMATANRRAFSGQTQVLTLASGCHARIAASLPDAITTDAMTFLLARADRLRFRDANGARVALHRPCTQRVSKSDLAQRALLMKIPGLDLIDLPDTGCCGAAGLHMADEPARAAALRQPLLDALPALQASAVLSANIGCRLHLAEAAGLPVRHPIDFLAEHLK